jgi:hypothetical protein
MNETIFATDPEPTQPMMQEAGLGASASAEEAAIEQIVAEKQSDADVRAYVFIP